MNPRSLAQVIDRKRYSTDTATLLSGNDWWDGHNWERSCRNTFLYRTKKGAYFAAHLTCWQGECDYLEVLTESEAIELFEAHAAHDENRISFEEAFPEAQIEEA